MRDTFLRLITDDERNTSYDMMQEVDSESGYRAKIILLKDDGHAVPEMRRITGHHDVNIRKWIHRFNEKGIDGIASKIHKHKSIKISDNVEKEIVDIATKNPREGYGLPFSTWSLRVLAGYISKEINLVDTISHTEIRNILLKHGIRHRQSKITLGNSQDPEYHLKKRGLRIQGMATFQIIVFYSTKTRKDPSWQKHMGVPLGHPHSPRYPRPRRQMES